jgi:hypothetical protein
MVQATLITSYCLQSQLLSLHVQLLREKLLQYVISHGDWMHVSTIQYGAAVLSKEFPKWINNWVCNFIYISTKVIYIIWMEAFKDGEYS